MELKPNDSKLTANQSQLTANTNDKVVVQDRRMNAFSATNMDVLLMVPVPMLPSRLDTPVLWRSPAQHVRLISMIWVKKVGVSMEIAKIAQGTTLAPVGMTGLGDYVISKRMNWFRIK